MTVVSADEARRHFATLLETAFYQNVRIHIKRNNKPMAWLVGEPYMAALDQIIAQLVEHHPALADTLAISLDDDLRHVIEQGTEEVKAGRTIPIERLLDE